VTTPTDTDSDVARYERLCREKAEAELAAADGLVPGSDRVRSVGDALAEIVLVKGSPGPEDRTAGRVLAGPDGEAAAKALDALGLPAERYAVCSRPGRGSRSAGIGRLALVIESVDPALVIALDTEAAADVAKALGEARLVAGRPTRIRGRTVLAIDGLEASLGDERLKRRVWRQLRTLVRPVAETNGGRP